MRCHIRTVPYSLRAMASFFRCERLSYSHSCHNVLRLMLHLGPKPSSSQTRRGERVGRWCWCQFWLYRGMTLCYYLVLFLCKFAGYPPSSRSPTSPNDLILTKTFALTQDLPYRPKRLSTPAWAPLKPVHEIVQGLCHFLFWWLRFNCLIFSQSGEQWGRFHHWFWNVDWF